MLDVLADNEFLTLFLVIALGAGLGAVPIAGIRFGAAGALFVGLVVGAIIPEPTADLSMLQNLGLGLFVYLVGLEAGETFFKELRQQFGMMITAVVAITVGAVVAVVAGQLLGVTREITVGIFSGALTNTPSLALAQTQTGSELPAVGYSLGYPTGVIVAILMVSVLVGRTWKAPKDQVDPDDAILEVARVEIGRAMTAQDLVDIGDGHVRVSTVRRGNRSQVIDRDRELDAGDVVTIYAAKSALPGVVKAAGRRVPRRMLRDQHVGLQRFTLSNRSIVGRPVGEVPLYERYRSRITRIRRVDEEMLATSETYLEMGDIVEVAYPIGREDDLAAYLGDSKRDVSEVDLVAFAGGLTLGFAAALIVIPLPAGASFALGSAAGPLIVGLILGALRNTPMGTTWKLPRTANFTLRQFGLMLFLAAVGVASGPAFASTAFTWTGLISVLIAALITLATCGVFYILTWLQGRSATRASGGVAGLLGQPAVLQFALGRSSDGRVTTGYSTVITVAVLFKIVAVPLMLAVI